MSRLNSTQLDRSLLQFHSLQKKVHAVLLFTAIELPFARLPRAFFELWRAINYAISDIAWRTIFCTLYSAFSSVNDSCFMCFDTFFFPSTLFFRRGQWNRVYAMIVEDDWSAVISPGFIINSTAVLLDSGESEVGGRERESEMIFTFSERCILRSLNFPIFLHLFIFNVERRILFFQYYWSTTILYKSWSRSSSMRTINFTLPRKEIQVDLNFFPKWIFNCDPRRITKNLLSVSSARWKSFN